MHQNHYVECWDKWHFPVLRVPKVLNPFHDDGVDVFVAMAYHLPYENIKFLSILGMMMMAERSGALDGVEELVEATSGNAGVVLAHVAPPGIRVRLIAPADIPDGKSAPMLLAGARVEPPPNGMTGVQYARELCGGGWDVESREWHKKDGRLNLDQYACPLNATLHESFTAPQILANTPKKPKYFCAGIGTGGTIIGVSNALRRKDPKTEIVGVLCAQTVPMTEVPGVRDRARMKDIKLPWEAACDHIEEVEKFPSYLVATWFHRFMKTTPGGSSGFDYVGAMRHLRKKKEAGKLPGKCKDEDREIMVVIFPDSSRPYGDRFAANIAFTEHELFEEPLPWHLVM